MIIAIDGPAGSGKSTVAKAIAARLQYKYLDTGAMYRSFTWKLLQSIACPKDGELDISKCEVEEKICQLLKVTRIELINEAGVTRIILDGKDVTDKIRSPIVDKNVSYVSSFECVREKMVEMQRRIGASGNVVVEGRDIGTVVFPNADKKFYLDAAPEIRAKRRYLDISSTSSEDDISLDIVVEEILRRDKIDSSREFAPLKKADDAIYIDTSDLSVNEVVELLMKEIETETMV